MTNPATASYHQPDNLLGICHRIGEDFGFNPLWLRLALGCSFVFAPVAVVAAYLAMGAVVIVSRLLFSDRRRASAEVVTLPAPAIETLPEFAKAA